MKIIVLSDTHSVNDEILEYLLDMEKPDMIFHLGDYVEDGEFISEKLAVPSVIVKGNGDYLSDYKEEEIIDIKEKKIFLTHGHKYKVTFSLNNIFYRGKEVGVDIILFGHTHMPVNTKEDGIYIMNPGSPSFPRTASRKKTFGIIEIDEEIKMEIIEIGE